MPPRKRKAVEEAPAVEENPLDDIEVPALPDDEDIPPMPSIESPQQDMGALAAAAAAAVAVTQPPPMTDAEIAATTAVTAAAVDPAVSRKEKSLAVLCLNFMAVAREAPFSPEGYKVIEIQQIAEQLGAKRRRIYDIINILESVNIVSRLKKNTYQWNGTDGLPRIFALLQKEGLEEMAAKEAEEATADGVKLDGGTKPDGHLDTIAGKKTKGVAKTCKKFFQIFLTTGQTHVAVSDAANIIEGPLTPANQKALTRRIYDIANVLQSCGIIEKYNVGSTSEMNKPGFRWSYQVSPDEMSKYLPEGHHNALPLGTLPSHNPWSVPMGPNPTLDDPAPEPLDEPLADPVALPPADADADADTTEI
jgi:transcription factor E2F7/8